VTRLAEGLHARPDHPFHGLARGLQIVVRVELLGVFGEHLADGAS